MNAFTSKDVGGAAQGAEHVIVELTQRLADRDGEIRSLLRQNAALSMGYAEREAKLHTSTEASEELDRRIKAVENREGEMQSILQQNAALSMGYVEREEQLRKSAETIQGLEKLARDLQHTVALQRDKLLEKEERIAKLVKVEEEIEANRAAVLEAEDMIARSTKERDEMIAKLNKERDELISKSEEADKKTKQLENELSSHQKLLQESKSLAEENIKLEVKNSELEEVVESLEEQQKKNTQDSESKEALLNMLRQELGEKEHLIEMFETKFDAKNVDIPQVVARADEGERLWAKIEEREKKFAAKEVMMEAFRDENTNLLAEKKRLQGEVDELKSCFETYELKLNGTNSKVHKPWLLAQLRDSVALKERVTELEEIIECEGYTIKAKEAENSCKEKEKEMELEMAKVSDIIETLKGQTAGVQNLEVPVLLGKLEECLRVFGEEGEDCEDGDDSEDDEDDEDSEDGEDGILTPSCAGFHLGTCE